MKFSLALFSFLIITILHLNAQDTLPYLRWHLNAGARLGFNTHTTDVHGLRGVESCCPGYEAGSGTGLNVQAQWLKPVALNDDLCLGLEAGVENLGATLKTTETTTVDDDGSTKQGVFEHTLKTALSVADIRVIGRMRLWNNINVSVGAGAGFTLAPAFEQKEQLIEPNNLVFVNGTKLRNQRSGTLPDASSLHFLLNAALSYRLPVDTGKKWHLVPELRFTRSMTNVITTTFWRANSLSVGLSLEYSHYTVDEIPPVVIPIPPPDTPKVIAVVAPPPEKPAPKLDVVQPLQIQLRGENGKPIDTVIVTNVVATTMFAMMNYIFFDSASATIPQRYVQLRPDEAQSYKPAQLEGKGTLGIYYQSLNTLGFRLRNSASKITLVGCNANSGVEKNNLPLSRARAEQIRDYLVNVWKIDPKRITVSARNLPEVQSNITTKEGDEENRRVEIQFNDLTLFEPLVFQDTSKTLNNISMGFTANVASEAGVESWELSLLQGKRKLAAINGKDSLPAVISQKWDERSIPIPEVGVPLVCKLSIRDKQGSVVTTQSQPVTVQQNTVQKFVLKKYSLIVFKFNESDVNASNQRILDIIKAQIKPNSVVTVRGYTDKYGLEEYNQKLSERRAKEIARLLKLPDSAAQGVGGAEPLYDNATPEGRFYSRTVQITVETPVE